MERGFSESPDLGNEGAEVSGSLIQVCVPSKEASHSLAISTFKFLAAQTVLIYKKWDSSHRRASFGLCEGLLIVSQTDIKQQKM